MKYGIYYELPFEQYAAEDALNGSSIVHMRRSPMHYRYMKDHPQPTTPALKLGIATHRLILEPTKVDDFAVWGLEEDQKVRRGKVWDAFSCANSSKMIVTEDECAAMVGMAVGARKNLPIRKYADAKGPTEVSLFWVDHVTGRRMKARIDKWIPTMRAVFDLKTTRDCRAYKFGAQSYALGYHIKMAIQHMGVMALLDTDASMKLGAIESKAPHESAVYRIPKDVLLQGKEELDEVIKVLVECEKTGTWPADQPEESDLQLPTRATSTDNDEDLALEGLEMDS